MISVLDASAAVEIALQKPSADRFKEELLSSALVLSPDLYISEVTNVFWKYNVHSGLDAQACLAGIVFCVSIVDEYVPAVQLWRECFFEAARTGATAYDMFYLVVARRHHAQLLTRDGKLAAVAHQSGIRTVT